MSRNLHASTPSKAAELMAMHVLLILGYNDCVHDYMWLSIYSTHYTVYIITSTFSSSAIVVYIVHGVNGYHLVYVGPSLDPTPWS